MGRRNGAVELARRLPQLAGVILESGVAELAAGGSSNKEIAQSLFVTLRTVELHLSNAYNKLQIRSRHELDAALDAVLHRMQLTP